jgi:hypothetical protein
MSLSEQIAALLTDNFITIHNMNENFKTIYSGGNNKQLLEWFKNNPDFIIHHIYGNGYEDYYLDIYVYKEEK